MYQVTVAESGEIEASRERWNQLVLLMPVPAIFCTWEWISAWLEQYGKGCKPLILFIYEEKNLKGIFPLALYEKGIGPALTPTRLLSYCGSQELFPDHLDMISSQEDADFCIKAVFEFLATEYRNWDLIDLSLLSEGGNLISYLKKEEFFFDYQMQERFAAPFIPLSGRFEDYLATFDGKQRYNRKRGQKKLYEEFDFKYLSCDPSKYEEGLKTLFDLHEARAKSKNMVSTFSGERIFDFHRLLLQKINGNNWLWMRFIRNEKKVISALYGFAVGGHLFYYQLGLDPEWDKYGPGKALIYEVIKEAFARGYKEFDFLRGDEEYKSIWAKDQRSLYKVMIFNKTFRGECSRFVQKLKDLARAILK